jgi:glutamyl/glutaminyl-tRNA synthetase
LIGWSPRPPGAGRSLAGDDAELLPADELARRFSLERVGHSAGVFDEEKLAWANRHYLKMADPARIAQLSVPFFNDAGVAMDPDDRGMQFLAEAMAIVTSSVDRLDQVPARLAFLFEFSPERALEEPQIRQEMAGDSARAVVAALAEELATAPRLDRDRFRAVANQVKVRTGQKGKALFHPIRLALTGRAEGPELDLAAPALDRGAEVPPEAGIPPIEGCRERAAAFIRAVDQAVPRTL